LVRDAASAAEAVALNTAHRGLVAGNPHVVTVAELSLDNVDNTTDLLKPPSTAQIALNTAYALNAAKPLHFRLQQTLLVVSNLFLLPMV